ncbi:MAG: S41 family peptidase [Bacteroidia bacterium]|nr:S41 family peptidase [Bacteroidia bacterium]
MKRISLIALLILAATAAHAVTPLWLRDVRISPDGNTIAFCYKGDIWTVPANGGNATRLTTQSSYEAFPVWSPDSKQIAFASSRNGGYDIYLMSAAGGSAKRLTFNSASEIPSSFTADGKQVLFSASIQDPAGSALYPASSMTEVYAVPVTGGKSVQVLGTPAEMISYSPDGKFFLYQDRKGGEDEWRKHHTSSITRDIWRYDVSTKKHTNITNRAGEDRNPVLSADGKTAYVLSEVAGGSMNVWSLPVNSVPESLVAASDTPAGWKRLTSFDTHPVRFLSRGGETLCFTWDGEIYTMKEGSEPAKVNIDLTLDEDDRYEVMKATSGATSSALSPDGKQVAFIVRGEVFVTSVDYKTTKQITHTAAAERNVDFGHDCRSIVYSSERDGISQLYIARIARDGDPDFANATIIKEEPLLPDLKVERGYPTFSPDGTEVAFIENRTSLKVVDLRTMKVRTVTDGSKWYRYSGGFEYSWSPDGKWFTVEYTANKHEPYNDVGLVSAQGGEITNITASGYTSAGAKWVMDGNAILFLSEIYGLRAQASWGSQDDVFLCFLNQDAYDKYRLSKEDYELVKEVEKKDDKKSDSKEIKVELEGIRDRIVRVTPVSSSLGDAIVTKDGESMYYLASFEGGNDLWKLDLREKETKLVSKSAGIGTFVTDSTGKNIFLLGSTLKKMDGDKLSPISFNAEYRLDHEAEREYMFDYVYKEAKERFYTADMNGVDWDFYTEAYRKFLPHINNNYDFQELLSEWLGELNVSHSGGRYSATGSSEPTAYLGLLYDLSYTGKGLKVAEVVKGGPFDHAHLEVKAGDIITHINGIELTPEEDISVLLMGQSGRKTLVTFKGDKEAVVLPVTSSAMSDLLYNRWVKQREADVQKWSGGRLGYVHIDSMDDEHFRPMYSDVLGRFNNCEGIVIDTRFNGGGRLHEDIEAFFSGEKYLTQVIRGRESCDMPSRRWNKPSIMIQCEANYSNAHGTPWVYQHQGIGKLVGAPVQGTMSTVNWIKMQDQTMTFGVPVIGYRTEEGYYLEGTQLEPDVLVLNAPETIVKGEDSQLKAAVEELLKEIDNK